MNEIRLPDKKQISIVKSKINQKFNDQRDQTRCAICGKELKNESKAFHKSHTVPFFCLENIKGYYNKNCCVLKPEFIGFRTIFSDKEYVGTNKAGVFYSICSKCDQEKFSIYESEEALLNKRPEEIMNSLALKIYLNELFNSRLRNFKNTIDHSQLTDEQMISSFFSSVGRIEEPTVKLDIRDFQDDLNFAKRSYENGYRNYKIIYHRILDYTVPIAAQTSIPISRNVDFTSLQDVNALNYKILEDLLICIFPLKEKSVIIVFYKIGDQLMKKYAKQFKKLSEEEKLREIFYLLIRYKASNYFFSPLIKEVLADENIRGVYSIEDTAFKYRNSIMDFAIFEDLSWKQKMPCILSEEYSIQNLSRKSLKASIDLNY